MAIGIKFTDSNDRVTFKTDAIQDYYTGYDPSLEADIVNYIKGRLALYPGAGTVSAVRTVETSTNL